MTKHDLKELAAMGAELGAAKAENEKLRGLLERIRTTCCQVRDAQDLDTAPGLSAAESLHEQIEKLDAALSQQAEPVPAQDEREAPKVVATAILGGLFHGGSGPELGEIDIDVCTSALETIQCETVNSSDDVFLPLMTVAQHERIVASLARPALTQGELNLVRTVLSGTVTDELVSRVTSALVTRPAQTEPQPIGVTAVAITRENEDGELYLDWLLEGGIAELEFAGQVLVVAEKPITDDEGSGEVYAAPIAQTAPQGKFAMGDRVRKTSGSEWQGRICGTYSTPLTPEGYAVESEAHAGSVQIYPAKALEAVR